MKKQNPVLCAVGNCLMLAIAALMATTSRNLAQTFPKISEGARASTDDTWVATSTTNAPLPRQFPTAIWSGSEMIIWGGFYNVGYVNSGGRYRPGIGWTATSPSNAPSARYDHSAVWTGSEMIVWGGYGHYEIKLTPNACIVL